MAQTKMTAIEKLLKGNLPRAVTDPYYSSLLAYALALDGSSTLEVERLTQQLMDNATSYLEGNVYREIFPQFLFFASFALIVIGHLKTWPIPMSHIISP